MTEAVFVLTVQLAGKRCLVFVGISRLQEEDARTVHVVLGLDVIRPFFSVLKSIKRALKF